MNKQRRKTLRDAISLLELAAANIDEAKDLIEVVKDEEEESYENLPEGVQCGERGDCMQQNIDTLDEVYSDLDEIDLQETIDKIDEVIG